MRRSHWIVSGSAGLGIAEDPVEGMILAGGKGKPLYIGSARIGEATYSYRSAMDATATEQVLRYAARREGKRMTTFVWQRAWGEA